MSILKIIAKKTSKIFLAIFMFAAFVFPSQAVVTFDPTSSYPDVNALTDAVANWFLSITAGLAVMFLIVGGIYYLTAFGDDDRMKEGKKIITYTIYGLVLILISYSVVLTLNNIIFG